MRFTMKKIILFCVFLCLPLLSCGGGDDGNDSGPGTNACSTLGLHTRIIHGTECSDEGSPVVMIVLETSDGSSSLCSGTMISSTDVLTAAHCFAQNPSSAYILAEGVRVNAVRYSLHPDVTYTGQSVLNDVAVLRLQTPVGLPTLPLLAGTTLESGDIIQIFGYGITEDQSSSKDTAGTLRSGEMLITSISPDHITTNYGGEGSNTCFGDSGGPAVFTTPAGAVGIVGITSSGALENCGPGDISLFANVQGNSILNFITQAVPSVGVI